MQAGLKRPRQDPDVRCSAHCVVVAHQQTAPAWPHNNAAHVPSPFTHVAGSHTEFVLLLVLPLLSARSEHRSVVLCPEERACPSLEEGWCQEGQAGGTQAGHPRAGRLNSGCSIWQLCLEHWLRRQAAPAQCNSPFHLLHGQGGLHYMVGLRLVYG